MSRSTLTDRKGWPVSPQLPAASVDERAERPPRRLTRRPVPWALRLCVAAVHDHHARRLHLRLRAPADLTALRAGLPLTGELLREVADLPGELS
ncbi:MAG: hypothetical protein JWR62_3277 [Modestobacter sp.]|nr:hypothetical protein [Modestobacter sp.]